MASQPHCRFCSNPVKESRDICLECRLEGATIDEGLPTQEELEGLKEHQLNNQQKYHGPSIRDDI